MDKPWNALNTPEMMCLVLCNLPGLTREKWGRNVMSIQYSSEEKYFL